MQSLQAETAKGKTVIASLHDLTLAKQYCSRIWVINEGELMEDTNAKAALGADILARVFKIKLKNGAAILA